MKKNEFKNRIKELKLLNELYEKGTSKLIVLFGRRRVGKTELLKEFLKKHKGIYILGRQESEAEQLKKISSQIAEYFNDSVLKLNPFSNWDSLFIYLSEKPRIPIVFDEFPYIVQSSKKILSILQEYWDNAFSKKNSFIILCGSSINMMEKLLGHKSPIYGRRTEQILLEPLKFKGSSLFFPEKMSVKDKILYYSILGGFLPIFWNLNLMRALRKI
jgi:AAA+ ATPase superfamily predicted ATPase